MYSVIIVDDEPLIRIGVKSCIPWEEYGFEVAGQAKDGKKAIELIEQVNPDIVITDIKMPNMDGIELIAYLRENYPKVKSIVLSCYNEFDYVRQALKLGAEDYILKLSMEPENLVEVLLKVKQRIDEDREKSSIQNSITDKLWRNKYLIREDYFRKLIAGSISGEKLEKELQDFNFDAAHYRVICCEVDDYHEAIIRSNIDDRYLLKFSLLNILDECIKAFCGGDVIELEENSYIIILSMDKEIDEKRCAQIADELCHKINDVLKMYLNITFSFGVSEIFEDYEEIKKQYKSSSKCLKSKFYEGKHRVIHACNAIQFNDRILALSHEEESRLVSSLGMLDCDGAKNVIVSFVSKIQSQKKDEPLSVRRGVVGIIHFLFKYARQYDDKLGLFTDCMEKSPFDMVGLLDTLADIEEYMKRFLEQYMQRLSDIREKSERWEIAKIKDYISKHVEEDIALEKAANICNISKSYFSTIFKSETGESFTDYLNRVKIQRARELILEEGLRAYEAAFAVGISDESYFSKLFKKYLGINPSEVRRNNKYYQIEDRGHERGK